MIRDVVMMLPPLALVNVQYADLRIRAGDPVAVRPCDVEALKAEGWIEAITDDSTEED